MCLRLVNKPFNPLPPHSESTGDAKVSRGQPSKPRGFPCLAQLQHHPHCLVLRRSSCFFLTLRPATTAHVSHGTFYTLAAHHNAQAVAGSCPLSASLSILTHDSLSPPHTGWSKLQESPPPQCCCSTRPGNHFCAPSSSRQAHFLGFRARLRLWCLSSKGRRLVAAAARARGTCLASCLAPDDSC